MKKLRLSSVAIFVFVAMLAAFTALPAYATELYAYQGHGGTMGHLGFYLIGGEYQIHVRAQLPIEQIRSGSAHACVFSAMLEWPDSKTVALGGGTTITNFVPFKLQTVLPKMSPGIYHFWVVPASTCDWVMNIVSTNQNPAGVGPIIQMLKTVGGNQLASTTASVSDSVQFFTQFRTGHNAQVPLSGMLQIIHNGHIVQTFPLQIGVDTVTRADELYVDLQWNSNDAKFLGSNTAKFIVKIGSEEFTSTAEFTLTK